MKALFTYILAPMLFMALFATVATSCDTRVTRDQRIVETYMSETTLFDCKVVYLNDYHDNDTSKFIVKHYYVLAKDVFDAQRLFNEPLTDMTKTLNGVEVYWTPLTITETQSYPYNYE